MQLYIFTQLFYTHTGLKDTHGLTGPLHIYQWMDRCQSEGAQAVGGLVPLQRPVPVTELVSGRATTSPL